MTTNTMTIRPNKDLFVDKLNSIDKHINRQEYNNFISKYLNDVREYMAPMKSDSDYYDNLYNEMIDIPEFSLLKLNKSWNKDSSKEINEIYEYITYWLINRNMKDDVTYPVLENDFYLEFPDEWTEWAKEEYKSSKSNS